MGFSRWLQVSVILLFPWTQRRLGFDERQRRRYLGGEVYLHIGRSGSDGTYFALMNGRDNLFVLTGAEVCHALADVSALVDPVALSWVFEFAELRRTKPDSRWFTLRSRLAAIRRDGVAVVRRGAVYLLAIPTGMGDYKQVTDRKPRTFLTATRQVDLMPEQGDKSCVNVFDLYRLSQTGTK